MAWGGLAAIGALGLKLHCERRLTRRLKSFFKDKVVWLTGASSGIGEALAYELDRYGAKVILSARRKDMLYQVKLRCQNPDHIAVLPLDLEDLDRLPDKAQAALKTWGNLDIVIHNGGIGQRAYAQNTPLEIDQHIMTVNYFGAVALTKALLPHLLAQRHGHLVVISSLVGKFGTPYRSAYAASKHALHGFFDSLRAEVAAENIQVTLACPGSIQTDITSKAFNPTRRKFARQAPWSLSAAECARQILSATCRQQEEVLVGRLDTLAVPLKRLAPGLFSKLIQRVRTV